MPSLLNNKVALANLRCISTTAGLLLLLLAAL
jgi:hypothetical protein